MGDVNLEIKLSNLDERVIKIEESGGGSGGDDYITSVSNDFNVVNKKLSLSNNVTTKLSKVDTPDNLSVELAKKIDKPASATDGQVLTYNGTSNEWEARKSQGNTEIISDEWVSGGTYAIGDYAIDNNVLYKCVGDGGGDIRPSENTGQTIWKSTSVGYELSNLISFRDIITSTKYTINANGTLDFYIPDEQVLIDGKQLICAINVNANNAQVIVVAHKYVQNKGYMVALKNFGNKTATNVITCTFMYQNI